MALSDSKSHLGQIARRHGLSRQNLGAAVDALRGGETVKSADEESQRGALVVCLVHARTDTRWWHDWAMKATEVRFVVGRLKFGDGKIKATISSKATTR